MSTAVVIPFRNRDVHLKYFLENTAPLLNEYLPTGSKLIIVEQDTGKLFNRGMILNVAFKEFKDEFEYFITQDVDINPSAKCIDEYFTLPVDDNAVLGIFTSIYDTLGGIIKIKSSTIHRINGFPNDIFGWGAEDKALQNRAEFFGIKKITNFRNNVKNRDDEFFKIFDDVNDRNTSAHDKNRAINYITFKTLKDDEKRAAIFHSGLNNISYTITDSSENNFVRRIKVVI